MLTPTKLISLAGGGVGAIGPVAYIAEIEAVLCNRLAHNVPIVANSGGAIDAGFMVQDWRAKDIESYWDDHIDGVFGERSMQGRFALAPKYRDGYVMRELNKHMSVTLGALKGKHLFIVAWDKVKRDIKVFSSEDDKDKEIPLWYAVRASMAAPTYFDPLDQYYDGGLTANDPAKVGADALRMMYGKSLELRVAHFVTSGKQPDGSMPKKAMSHVKTLGDVVIPAVTQGNSANVRYSLIANGHSVFTVRPEHEDYVLDDVTFATECKDIWQQEAIKTKHKFLDWWVK